MLSDDHYISYMFSCTVFPAFFCWLVMFYYIMEQSGSTQHMSFTVLSLDCSFY